MKKTTIKVKQLGVSMIEMVIFIVLIGVIGTALMVAMHESLKTLPENADDIVAINLAQARVDLLLGRKAIQGFASFTDPCTLASPPAICDAGSVSGFTVTSTITRTYSGDSNLGTINVLVTGKGRAELETLIGNAS